MRDTMRAEKTGAGTGTFMMGILCGAAVGAAVGMLFAPKPGAEMRAQLADQTDWLRRQAAEQTEWLRRRAAEMYSGASETMNTMMARGREAYDVGREAFDRARPHNGHAGDMG